MMYDIIIFETSVLVLLHENDNPAFSKISLRGPFSKTLRILVPEIAVFVWTEG